MSNPAFKPIPCLERVWRVKHPTSGKYMSKSCKFDAEADAAGLSSSYSSLETALKSQLGLSEDEYIIEETWVEGAI
jgi:hypothetical protein